MHIGKRLKYWAIQITRSSKSTGILLICCTALSLILTNTSFGDHYLSIWDTENHFLQKVHFPLSIKDGINDGLMAIFFLIAGIEIKKEILVGEFSSPKKAVMPLLAAVGGVLFPAIIYLLCNKGTVFQGGWGIPTATDIAFSIGIMSMLGKKYVPFTLRIFLTALAIMDDLIAILLVAFFYGGVIHWLWLGIAVVVSVILYFLFKKKKNVHFLHIALGVVLWYCMFRSGIHATIAGVLFAFLIPLQSMEPLEKALHKPVNFFIIPIFAIANTCIPFNVDFGTILKSSLFWGIGLGLFIGKVLGISLVSFMLVKLKWASLPNKTSWMQFIGAGFLAGIGFTMSIFIASLAFDSKEYQEIAKIAILVGSFLSMIVGNVWLRVRKIN
ncbi:MAG: Na+/H+ antiporter NhaA [Pseudopedobacter saltans]|uniref:Na(+)/H(+) antiporter NhaA n=1 Tax=Pseudopedobacter saltans TaxID=151895 RepID=A0A2W5ELW5_9SPHI|nr:MAG: Na+/H+ antiporter NhaA [Pseudopedobacter saltans]